MKHRYWLYLREGGCYYLQDATTRKRRSVRTTNRVQAERLRDAKNQAVEQPQKFFIVPWCPNLGGVVLLLVFMALLVGSVVNEKHRARRLLNLSNDSANPPPERLPKVTGRRGKGEIYGSGVSGMRFFEQPEPRSRTQRFPSDVAFSGRLQFPIRTTRYSRSNLPGQY